MRKVASWLSFAVIIILYSCSNNETDVNPSEVQTEALTEEEVKILDDIPTAKGFSTASVVLPNGQFLNTFSKYADSTFYKRWARQSAINKTNANLGPGDLKDLLIMRIAMIGFNLTDRSRYQKPLEGENKPAQNGLAYSWGGKDYTVRKAPPGGGTLCKQEIYGLDCSGLIGNLFNWSGVNLTKGPADQQRKPEVLKAAILKAFPELNGKMKVEDLGQIPSSKFQTGDIIYWKRSDGTAYHIGIILENFDGKLAVMQSNGSPARNSITECGANLGLNRGPRLLELNDPDYFKKGKPYGITRMSVSLDLGDQYQGGVIAYFFQPGDPGYKEGEVHGLITTQETMGSPIRGGYEFIPWGTAVSLCNNLVFNGFNDWYLPSQGDLIKLSLNRRKVLNNFTNQVWSSTEVNNEFAVAFQIFYEDGLTNYKSVKKSTNLEYRPFRTF